MKCNTSAMKPLFIHQKSIKLNLKTLKSNFRQKNFSLLIAFLCSLPPQSRYLSFNFPFSLFHSPNSNNWRQWKCVTSQCSFCFSAKATVNTIDHLKSYLKFPLSRRKRRKFLMRIKHVVVAVFIMCDKITRWPRL